MATPPVPPGKGKRKVDFSESQRFKGKTFFLDLPGYKRANQVEQELCMRGATVQAFLDNKVRYLITNKSKETIDNSKSRALSSVSPRTNTPSTGGTCTSQLASPKQFISPGSDLKMTSQRYYTRTQRIAQMAKQKQSNKEVDVLKMASGWKCKILHISELERQLKKLPPLYPHKCDKEAVKPDQKVRWLRRPFLKVEDQSYQYRPMVYEASKWLTPDIQSSIPHTSPFLHTKSRRARTIDHRAKDNKDHGYCEPCGTRFADLATHLMSVQHMLYAENQENFSKLDDIISQCPSLDDFVSSIKQTETKSNNQDSPSPNACPSHSPMHLSTPLLGRTTPPRGDRGPDVTPSSLPFIKYSPRLMVTKVLPSPQDSRIVRRCGKEVLPMGITPMGITPMGITPIDDKGIKRHLSVEHLEAKKMKM